MKEEGRLALLLSMVLIGEAITCSPPVTLTLGDIYLHFILRISGCYPFNMV